MADEKIYADGFLIKAREVTFDGTPTEVLSVSIKVEDFKTFLDNNANSGGWVKLDLRKRKTPSDKGQTHYALLDTWEPNKSGGDSKPAAKTGGKPAAKAKAAPAPVDDDDDIPF